MMSNPTSPNYRKMAMQMVAGGLFGFLSMTALVRLVPELGHLAGGGAVALLAIGMVYAMMGLLVGIGVLFPALGARFLNNLDRDDLADQRAVLTGSAVSCLLLGASEILVALSGPEGRVPGAAAVTTLAAALVLASAITILQWRRYDEMMRSISFEASAIMAGILMVVVMIWAALAYNEALAPLDPLGLIALISAAMLLGSFLAAARRGLMTPR